MGYWQAVWKQFRRYKLGLAALTIIILFILAGVYAPILASSKPLAVHFKGEWYFPLFRYLFYPRFFTKSLDIFYNLMMFTLPLGIFAALFLRKSVVLAICVLQVLIFVFLFIFPISNPAPPRSNYENLNAVLRYQHYKNQHEHLKKYEKSYIEQLNKRGLSTPLLPSLWNLNFGQIATQEKLAQLEQESKELTHVIMPIVRNFHWEDDAGGDQALNRFIPWSDLTRINRKDMVAALIFGIRISLSVGILAIAIALSIGIPIGACAGYYGGKFDLMVYRLIEIWESMPTFFMLLMIVAFLQTKSIFLVIFVIGLFGWTGFSRFIRGEFLKQKQLLYIEACHAMGYPDRRIIFSHLLPNAIPPLLTLVPFAIMGAITTEAGLSFLGLGEEGSSSWGILMDEGRSAFPSESYLLWPPAILLTLLLVSIALVGDTLRDALDPKLNSL